MTEPIRAAIVGGHRGGGYSRALAALADQIILTAICDIDAGVVAAWQQAQPGLRAFTRYEDLLESDACDAVLLATPMLLHAGQAIQALHAGKHVLSEVIAATTLEECWALVEAAQASPAVYMMAENYTYMRPNMMVRHMVERGVFGTVSYAEGAYIHDCRPLMFDAQDRLTWRGELAREAGHGGGDYFIIEDFVSAVQGRTPPAVDVYDAVTWSSIFPLSMESVARGGQPVPVPDFRRG